MIEHRHVRAHTLGILIERHDKASLNKASLFELDESKTQDSCRH